MDCIWTADEEGNWSTSCDNLHCIIGGTPKENLMEFCCYCGKHLKEINLQIGDKVHYQPEHYGEKKWENGIVKEIRNGGVWVVYNCAGNWERYWDYTGAKTNMQDLKIGWRE